MDLAVCVPISSKEEAVMRHRNTKLLGLVRKTSEEGRVPGKWGLLFQARKATTHARRLVFRLPSDRRDQIVSATVNGPGKPQSALTAGLVVDTTKTWSHDHRTAKRLI